MIFQTAERVTGSYKVLLLTDEMNDDDGGYIRKVTRHLFYLGVLEGFW
jgi:hypothetical protein